MQKVYSETTEREKVILLYKLFVLWVCFGRHLSFFHKEPASQQERVTANCINVCGATDESTEFNDKSCLGQA